MNRIKASIESIEHSDNLSLISLNVYSDKVKVLLNETPLSNPLLKQNQQVLLLFKENQLALAKNLEGFLSFSNRLKAKVLKIESDKLFSRIEMDYKGNKLVALLPKSEIKNLFLELGEIIDVLIPTSSISILNP